MGQKLSPYSYWTGSNTTDTQNPSDGSGSQNLAQSWTMIESSPDGKPDSVCCGQFGRCTARTD